MMQKLSVGERIKFLRGDKKISQEKLAQQAALTKEYIGRIERDQVNNVGFQTYESIANALDVDVRLVLFGEARIYAPNTIQGMAEASEIKVPGQEVLPLSQEELDMILDFRTVKDKGTRRTIKEVVQSFSKRR